MTAEEWRSIPGFPDYWVSSLGRVVSLRRRSAYEMRGGHNQRGYRMVALRDPDGNVTMRTVHRLVADAFLGPRPQGMETRHIDGDKSNNAASNLGFCTSSENTLDLVKHGNHNNARKIKCLRDHPFTPENTRVSPRGSRQCLPCLRLRRDDPATFYETGRVARLARAA